MSGRSPRIRVERAREVVDRTPPAGECWVLVDRLWPRGVKKERLSAAEWDRDAAPSDDLRRAYHGERIDHEEFAHRYHHELANSGAARALGERCRAQGCKTLVLLVDSHDPASSHGAVLADALRTQD